MPQKEKITKFYRAKVRSIDPVKRTAEVVISSESLDRYKERVMVDAFNKKTIEKFMEHPVLLSSHRYSSGLLNQIGEFLSIKVDKDAREVVAVPQYYAGEGNPEADWGWKLVEKGMAAYSIGFIPTKSKRYGEDELEGSGGSYRDYLEIELLEASHVIIPANPAALQKSFEEEKDPDLKDYYEEILILAEEIFGVTEDKKKKPDKDDDDDKKDDDKKDVIDESNELKPAEEKEEKADEKDWQEKRFDNIEAMLTLMLASIEELKIILQPPSEPAEVESEEEGCDKPKKKPKKDIEEEKEKKEEEAELENIVGEEKLLEMENELRASLGLKSVGDEQKEAIETIRSFVSDINKEIAKAFFVQPQAMDVKDAGG